MVKSFCQGLEPCDHAQFWLREKFNSVCVKKAHELSSMNFLISKFQSLFQYLPARCTETFLWGTSSCYLPLA